MLCDDRQLTIAGLLTKLYPLKHDADVTFGFAHLRPAGVDSYRGYPSDLAIGYKSGDGGETKVADLIAWLEDAIGKTYQGYKGGEYRMSGNTAVWVANWGESGGTAIVDAVDHEGTIILKTECVD